MPRREARKGASHEVSRSQASPSFRDPATAQAQPRGHSPQGQDAAAGITYTYKVNNLADWAKKHQGAGRLPFRFVKSVLDGAGSKESKHAIKLTSQGWEAKGLD